MAYVAVQPLVIVKTEGQGYVHVYAGGPVPDGAAPGEVERLLEDGFIAEVDDVPAEGEEHPKRRTRS